MKHEGLIAKIAWSFARSTRMDFDDLFQEGCIALLEAEEKFDPDRGVRFSTFAYWAIKNHILNYINREKKKTLLPLDDEQLPADSGKKQEGEFLTRLESHLSADEFEICQRLLDLPLETISAPRGIVARSLRKEGWKHARIWRAFAETKKHLQEV